MGEKSYCIHQIETLFIELLVMLASGVGEALFH